MLYTVNFFCGHDIITLTVLERKHSPALVQKSAKHHLISHIINLGNLSIIFTSDSKLEGPGYPPRPLVESVVYTGDTIPAATKPFQYIHPMDHE
jgi:hypothetical protein